MRGETGSTPAGLNKKATKNMKWLKSWFLIPLLLTGGWLLVVAYLTGIRWDQFLAMPLNELGDFFAGVAAPLAFLWIVFGYLQHGNEIQDQALITSRLVDQKPSNSHQLCPESRRSGKGSIGSASS